MGYREGEGVLDQSYCEADVLRGAGKNINRFIEVIIAIALGLAILGALGSTLVGMLSCFGGCLGCDACIETAACADDCMDDVSCGECGNSGYGEYGCWEEKTRENIQKADDCASCEGIDCFGRQGCFSCGGCGDCADCNGTKYYSITIHDGGSTTDLSVDEDYNYITSVYNLKKSSQYYKFIGMYDKESGGKCYVDENGEIVKKLKNGLNLYARYEERNVGVEYHFHLKLEAFGMDDKTIALQVGGPLTGLPVAPEKEGYSFVGWYIKDKRIFTGNVQEGMEFHLSTFGIDPYTDEREFTLYPKYEPKKYTVTFRVQTNNYQGGYNEYEIIANYGDTYANAYAAFDDEYYVISDDDNFFGWGMNSTSEPEDRIGGEATITGDVTLYAILREAIHLEFRHNTGRYDEPSPISVKVQEGKLNVRLDELPELAIFKTESANPGYKFIGWYTSPSMGQYNQVVQTIDRVSLNTPRTYYAQWEKAMYTIEYYVTNHYAETTNKMFTGEYQMSNQAKALQAWTSEMDDGNFGYEFKGWCESPTYGDTPKMELSGGTYGNKKLYAKYEPKSYNVGLIAPNGTFNNGSNMSTATITYGNTYNLEEPTRAGYDFVGYYLAWDYSEINSETAIQLTDSEGISKQKFTVTSLGLPPLPASEERLASGSLMLWAKWKIKTFTVTFMSDEEVHERVTVNWHQTTEGKLKLPDPVKEGYDFKGWTYKSGSAYSHTTQIDQNLTIYAKFEIKRYDVVFVIDNLDYKVQRVDHGTTLSDVVARIAGRPNDESLHRRLLGWYTDEYLTTQMKDREKVEGALRLYAKFQYADLYTFRGATTTSSQYYFVGDTVNFPSDSKYGYDFKGWCDDEGFSTTPLYKEVKITQTMADGDREYHAKHTPTVYNITYKLDNVTVYDTDTYTIEQTKTLLAEGAGAPNKRGYQFLGWKLNNTGSIITYLSGRTGDVDLYAQFKALDYTVTLCREGGYIEKTVTFDSGFSLGVPARNKEGYDFIGWSWNSNGTISDLVTDDQGNSLTGVKYDKDYDTSAYPIYKIKQYKVYWLDSADNSQLTTSWAEHFGTVAYLPATKTGYTFENWYADKACTQLYDFNATVTGEQTLYAKFTINSYTVQFIVDKNRTYTTEPLVYQSSLAGEMAAAQSYVDSYETETLAKFRYWTDDNGTQYNADSVVPAANLVLRAQFDMPIYVKFLDHNGTWEEKGPYYRGDSVSYYSYTRAGYTFGGWYTDGTLASNKQQSFPFTVDGTVTEFVFYPKWTANQYTISYIINGSVQYTQYYTMNQTENYGGLTLWMPSATGENKGQVFDGWYKDGVGSAMQYIDNSDVENDSNKIYGDLVFYGSWKAATYTVKFESDGVIQTAHTLQVKYGDYLTKLNWTPDPPAGKSTLLGWKIKDGAQLIDGMGNWTISQYNYDYDIVLEAIWI